MVKNCVVCGTKFVCKLARAKYCCDACKNKAVVAKLRKTVKHRCACGKRFGVGVKTQTYCSVRCASVFARPSRSVRCQDCDLVFIYHGRGWCLRCPECRALDVRSRSYRHMVKTGRIQKPGSGRGGNQFGPDNHTWKGGTKRSYKGNYRYRCFRLWGQWCVVCGDTDRLQVHHVDGNIKNPSVDNLVPLCWQCHWLVHKKRHKSVKEYVRALNDIWPDCRCKIAEKTGNPDNGQSEVKAVRKRRPAATTRGRNNAPTRPRRPRNRTKR